jgi:hypothetical protein
MRGADDRHAEMQCAVCNGGGVCCESLGYCAGWWWYGVFREGVVGNERRVGAASKQALPHAVRAGKNKNG